MNKKLYIITGLAILMLFSMSINVSAKEIDEDPKDDIYSMSFLEFMMVMGEEFPDEPFDEIEDVGNILEEMIPRSSIVGSPGNADLRRFEHHSINSENSSLTITVDSSFGNDNVMLFGIFETSDDYFSFLIQNSEDDETFEWRTEDDEWDENNTDGDISGDEATIIFPESAYDYDSDDEYILLTLSMGGGDMDSPEDFLTASVYYDYMPEDGDEQLSYTDYRGDDPITLWLSLLGDFIFWFLPGGLSFIMLVLLIIVGAQVLSERKNTYLHYIGMSLLIFMVWPIFFFAISLDLSSIVYFNFIAVIELIILLDFTIFIASSIMNSYGLLRRFKFPLFMGMSLMITESIMYVTLLYSGGPGAIISLFMIVGILIGIVVLLKFSRMYGRNAVES